MQLSETDSAYLVAAHLKLRHVPCRVIVGRPLHKAELCFVGGQVIVEVERELDYER